MSDVQWVMTERKILVVEERDAYNDKLDGTYRRTITKAFNPGDPVPHGHEGRPYTRAVFTAVEPDTGDSAPVKRGRKRRDE